MTDIVRAEMASVDVSGGDEAVLPLADMQVEFGGGKRPPILGVVEEFVRTNSQLGSTYHRMKCEGKLSATESSHREYSDLREFVKNRLITPLLGEAGQTNLLEDHNVLSGVDGAVVSDKVVFGHNALSSASNAQIESSVIWGHNALSGSGAFMDMDLEEATIYLRAIQAAQFQSSPEERTVFMEALRGVNQTLSDKHRSWYENWSRNVRPDIGAGYAEYEELAAAAHQVSSVRNHLMQGETYNPRVRNAVILGWNAMSDVVLGSVEDSIIGGYNAMNGSLGTHIRNSYIVHYEGGRVQTKYVLDNSPLGGIPSPDNLSVPQSPQQMLPSS